MYMFSRINNGDMRHFKRLSVCLKKEDIDAFIKEWLFVNTAPSVFPAAFPYGSIAITIEPVKGGIYLIKGWTERVYPSAVDLDWWSDFTTEFGMFKQHLNDSIVSQILEEKGDK